MWIDMKNKRNNIDAKIKRKKKKNIGDNWSKRKKDNRIKKRKIWGKSLE